MDKFDKVLIRIGMPANLKGYSCFHAALSLMEKDKKYYSNGVTRRLYPDVAKETGLPNWSCVERNLRTAKEKVSDRLKCKKVCVDGLPNVFAHVDSMTTAEFLFTLFVLADEAA